MTVSRRSFLTGAASSVAIAATGGIGAVAGDTPAVITAEDVAIARQYKSVFDTLRGKDAIAAGFERMLTYRDGAVIQHLSPNDPRVAEAIKMPSQVGCTELSDIERIVFLKPAWSGRAREQEENRLLDLMLGEPYVPENVPLPLITVAEEDILPVEIQGTIERTA